MKEVNNIIFPITARLSWSLSSERVWITHFSKKNNYHGVRFVCMLTVTKMDINFVKYICIYVSIFILRWLNVLSFNLEKLKS